MTNDWLCSPAGSSTLLVEAVRYLHSKVAMLHDDIKCDNVLVGKSVEPVPESPCVGFQLVLIDFGKATEGLEGKSYHLTACEREQYRCKYSHLAPEVVE